MRARGLRLSSSSRSPLRVGAAVAVGQLLRGPTSGARGRRRTSSTASRRTRPASSTATRSAPRPRRPGRAPRSFRWSGLPHDPTGCGSFDGYTYPTPVKGKCTVTAATGQAAEKTNAAGTPPCCPTDGASSRPATSGSSTTSRADSPPRCSSTRRPSGSSSSTPGTRRNRCAR